MNKDLAKYLEISAEVEEALKSYKPVVALESTIISHGMPYPQNMETALKVEEIIRKENVIPATIAIIKGKLKVGLSKDEIEILAKEALTVSKVSRRDLPVVVAKKLNGATTVATTMIIASMAGIKIFATGGIGGVHRGAEKTFDISADLEELAQTDVAVVCAGAKSILDLKLSLEYLETKGVPVLGYKTANLPAFYCQDSSYSLDYRIDEIKDFVSIMKSKWEMGLKGGIVIANPIPEEYAMNSSMIDAIIETALLKADESGIRGKNITPFLLDEIQKITGGKSLEANIRLVYNNARLASLIAKEYYK